MAHVTDTKITSMADKTVSGFLSAIRAGMDACSSSGSMFASLLAESKNADVAVDAYDPSANKTAATQTQTAADDRSAGRDYTQSRALSAEQGRAETPVKVEARGASADHRGAHTDAAANANENQTTAETQQAEPGDAQDTTITTVQAQASSEGEGSEKDEEEKSQALEELEALLAMLIPLAHTEGRAVIAETTVGLEKTVAETVLVDGEEMTDAQKAALARLTEIQEAITNDDGSLAAKTVTDGVDVQDSMESAVEDIANNILAMKGLEKEQNTNAGGQDNGLALGLKKEDQSAAELAALMKATRSQHGQTQTEQAIQKAEDPYALQRMLNDGGDAQAQMAITTTSATTIANAQTMTVLAGEAADDVAAIGGNKNSQSQNLIGGGVRTLGTYDFASQLSAARVSNGGTAGLPQAVEQVAVQLNKAAKDGVESITIQLKPAELGKIEIKLDFAVDKSVTGTVIADNQATLSMLQKDSASLQRALQEAGLQVQSGCLDFSLRDQGNAGQFAQGEANGRAQDNDVRSVSYADEVAIEAAATETYYITPGRVNLRV